MRTVSIARRLELPTWFVVAAIYGGWLALTWHATRLPPWVVAPLGAYLVAWHGSLQHETIHGHPTRSAWINTIVALPPLSLWIPYPIYRESHLVHHAVEELTCPRLDPESLYVEADVWERIGRGRRALWWIERRLLGRMLLGPITTTLRFWRGEVVRLWRGDTRHLPTWVAHLALVVLVIGWLHRCGLGLGTYLLAFAYPGFALSLVRSFTEHRPAPTAAMRSAIVETGPLTGLLFLHNNLHVLHHAEPSLPWFELPRRFRAQRGALLERNGGFRFAGYLEILARFGLSAKDPPVHPSRRPSSGSLPPPPLAELEADDEESIGAASIA